MTTIDDGPPRTSPKPIEAVARELLASAQAVVDAVTMDDSGMMVGTIWMGGHGGLLSRATLKAVDRLRLAIAAEKGKGEGA